MSELERDDEEVEKRSADYRIIGSEVINDGASLMDSVARIGNCFKGYRIRGCSSS
jgi:hypothetical protein